ncbi:MVD [Lepeophtheirus salmonis]|uniref:Diphosphomevalonate decarboxylase n=1 Tax=Lepeophtheirus salmonis TaxID=72036 RepID=A0A7R8CXH2_LEPSM|nr:MVD [Lepeophtheirus salmonis]CAF2961057.1 MVD [Lepeophtheirus salmonis]
MSLISNVPSSMDPIIVTCIAPVNIAVIKYYTNEMRATTSIMASSKFEKDQIWLNGREESMDNPRLIRCLSQVRNKSGSSFKNLKIRICSENNFPTAAGLASSAAGYACLVYALCQLFEVTGDISSLARLGSGSACRSTLGGFVQWHMGKLSDGSDSFSETIYPLKHWSDIKVLICVVSDSRKKVPSSVGMKNGVKTSTLLKYRVEKDVPERMNRILEAVKNKDFERFAEIVMKDSNQFHAICMDTYPPNPYLNDTSHSVSSLVCYTYDAGPNACLFMPSSNVNLVAGYIQHFFPPSSKEDFIIGKTISPNTLDKDLLQGLEVKSHPNGLKYLIATEIGDGPRLLSKDIKDSGIHLFDTSSGLPNKHN